MRNAKNKKELLAAALDAAPTRGPKDRDVSEGKQPRNPRLQPQQRLARKLTTRRRQAGRERSQVARAAAGSAPRRRRPGPRGAA